MVSSSSFMLGVIGGLLDFASATSILIGQGGSSMMNEYLLPADVWAAVLVVLGLTVVAVAFLSVMALGARYFKGFALSMILLGIIMAAIGTLMSLGSITGSSVIYSYGMVIVGVLMGINGAMMIRTPMPI